MFIPFVLKAFLFVFDHNLTGGKSNNYVFVDIGIPLGLNKIAAIRTCTAQLLHHYDHCPSEGSVALY